MQTLLVISVDHAGKPPPHDDDRGAGADLDGDGEVQPHEQEVPYVREYAAAAAREAGQIDAAVWIIDPGLTGTAAWYWQRHRQVIQEAWGWDGPVAYIAGHLNAGGGARGESWYHPDSFLGLSLAQHVAQHQKQTLKTIISAHEVKPAEGRRLVPIRGTYQDRRHGILRTPGNLAGVTFEPLFLDFAPHQAFIRGGGLDQVGRALARGVVAWGDAWTRARETP